MHQFLRYIWEFRIYFSGYGWVVGYNGVKGLGINTGIQEAFQLHYVKSRLTMS